MNGPAPDFPVVTVLMTVYNGLPYVREAVESVLNQTFSDFELLIMDDASTDGTPFSFPRSTSTTACGVDRTT